MRRYLLEVIACSAADARAAQAGGADRLELCVRLDLQGLTPPLDFVAEAAKSTSIPIRVMVRNNQGFQTTGSELQEMRRQVEAMAAFRLEGLVAGFHDSAGRLDFQVLDRLVENAPVHWKLTLHRAFDLAVGSAKEKLADVLGHGRADTILTGAAPGVLAGLARMGTRPPARPTLGQAGKAGYPAAGRLEFLLGGGLNAANVLGMLAASGCRQVHIGRAAREPAEAAAPVSEQRVRAFRELLDSSQ